MFEVRQETTVAAAHQLRFSPGEGERLHGHNWRIVAVVRCKELDARGMVLDFNDLGAELRKLVEPYEHVFFNEIPPYDDINPTAENIARVVAEGLGARSTTIGCGSTGSRCGKPTPARRSSFAIRPPGDPRPKASWGVARAGPSERGGLSSSRRTQDASILRSDRRS